MFPYTNKLHELQSVVLETITHRLPQHVQITKIEVTSTFSKYSINIYNLELCEK